MLVRKLAGKKKVDIRCYLSELDLILDAWSSTLEKPLSITTSMYSSGVTTIYDDDHSALAWPRVRRDIMPLEAQSSTWTSFPTELFPERSPGDTQPVAESFSGAILAESTIWVTYSMTTTIHPTSTSTFTATFTTTVLPRSTATSIIIIYPTSSTTIYPSSTETQPWSRSPSSKSPVAATVNPKSPTGAPTETSPLETRLAVMTITTLDHTYLITLQRSTSAPSPTTPSTSNATVATTVPGIDSNTTTEHNNTTRIALGVSIPLSIILIALLLAGAYLWGKRASRSFRNAPEDGPAQEEKQQGMETHAPPLEVPQELATEFNFAEMFVPEKPQEMAHQTPARPLDKEVVVDKAEGEGSKTAQREVVEVS